MFTIIASWEPLQHSKSPYAGSKKVVKILDTICFIILPTFLLFSCSRTEHGGQY